VGKYLAQGDWLASHAKVIEAWTRQGSRPRYQYVAGTALYDTLWIGRSLFALLPGLDGSKSNIRVNPFTLGELYDEESTPTYVVPDLLGDRDCPQFWK
jgi:hypothetical protein